MIGLTFHVIALTFLVIGLTTQVISLMHVISLKDNIMYFYSELETPRWGKQAKKNRPLKIKREIALYLLLSLLLLLWMLLLMLDLLLG